MTPRIERIYADARSRWPGIDVDRSTFIAYLLERVQPDEEDPGALHAADLYLACACVQGVMGALEAFERRYLTGLGSALRSIDSSEAFVDEVTQLVREKFFVGGKLAGYSGRGSLESWVAVAVHRMGLSLKRRQRKYVGLSEEAVSRLVPEDPEMAYLRAYYRDEFQAALSAALGGLSERQQVVLRLTVVRGVSHARIAAIYGVNQSTVTRWVTAARQQIWAGLRHQLSDRLRIGSGDVDSLIRFMKSDLHLSVSRVLRGHSPE